MWWYKLIRYWTKSDYAAFIIFNWFVVFGFSILVRLIQGKAIDFVFTIAFSFIMVPVSLVITVIFQKYSSNIEDISSYPALLPKDFKEDKLLRSDRILAFFYAEWCPFCRKSFHLLKFLNKSQSIVFRVDLSDESNPLWNSMKIKIVPTLIAFENGAEFWRVNGNMMIGLSQRDFERAALL